MDTNSIRALAQAAIAVVAVAGGIAYALIAQAHGVSPEPPAWLSVIIGGAVTFFYASAAHQNGQTSAITAVASAITARRLADTAPPPEPAPEPPA